MRGETLSRFHPLELGCSDEMGFSTAVKQFDTRFIDPAALPLKRN
jgi:hypothetical protein